MYDSGITSDFAELGLTGQRKLYKAVLFVCLFDIPVMLCVDIPVIAYRSILIFIVIIAQEPSMFHYCS